MSSDMRAKIIGILENWRGGDGDNAFIADRIIALFTPPATAKLPDGEIPNGVKIAQALSGRWVAYKGTTLIGTYATEDEATAALAAPPVPEEKPTTEHVLCQMIDKRDARISQLEAELKSAGECDRCGKPASTLCRGCEVEVMPTPDADVQAISAGLELVREHQDRIAELEANLDDTKWQRDMVNNELRKLMPKTDYEHLQHHLKMPPELPTPAAKPDHDFDSLAFQFYSLDGKAPSFSDPGGNGRALLARFLRENFGTPITETKPNPTIFSIPEMGLSPDKTYTIEQDGDTFKIAEVPKPDPLARAVTVGDMLAIADWWEHGVGNFAEAIRTIFTPPQGAEHGA